MQFGSDKQISILFFIVAFVLAMTAVVVGTVFYSTEEGGPAKYLGAGAFFAFILSLVFLQRSKNRKSGQPVVSGKRYASNLTAVVLFVPIYLVTAVALFFSLIWYGVFAGIFILCLLLLGPVSAILLALNKVNKAAWCILIYIIVSWSSVLLSLWRSGSI